ncbi:PAS domain S-box protein [Bremerella cremea]|uniref:PAS domain S-box protein n=1 Tax=Bremerella cremea TaxID=1031537 RepID=UPI0031E6CB1A
MADDSLQVQYEELKRQLADAQADLQALKRDPFGSDGHTPANATVTGSAGDDSQLFRLFLDEMPQGAVSLNHQGRIVFANERFAQMIGRSMQEVVGESLRAFVTQHDHATYDKIVNQQLEARRHGGVGFLCSNGSVKPTRLVLEGVPYQGGIATSILVTDITNELLQNERIDTLELLQVTLESIGDAVITTDANGRVVFLNPVAQKLTGWSNEQAHGQPLETVFQIVNETTGLAVENPISRCLREGRVVGLANHTILLAKDGSIYPIDDSAAPIRDDQNEVLGAVLVFRDISERREAEEAIRSARSRLNSTLAAGEIGTWEFDVTANQISADPNLARLFGVSDLAANGGALSEYIDAIHPDDRDEVTATIAKALEDDDELELSYRVINREGETRWLIARGQVERDHKGNAVRLPGVVVDVTGERRAEQQLRISESRWRLALEAAELGSWNIDPATFTMTTDERFRIIFTGKNDPIDYEQAIAAIHPDDRDFVQDGVTAATNPDDPKTYTAEYRVVHPDGTVRWVYAKGRSSFEQRSGKRTIVSFDGTVIDITDRIRSEEALRESEARFRQLANAIPQLAWTADPDGQINWYNQRWYQFTGTTEEAMKGWGWQSVQDPKVLPKVLKRWKASLKSGKPFNMAFPIRGADGEFRTFLTKVVPIVDSEGRITRWFGTNTDISDQYQLQEELRRIAADLSETDRRKDEFLATLAHELRNPLSPIKSAIQLMQLIEDDPAQYRELSELIDRQVVQMVRLIDDLLDISRISRGKIELKSEPCDLRNVVRTAVESATPFIKQSQHQLHVDVSSEPLMILGDSTRLAQVIVNLLNNSSKYTTEPGDIWLSARMESNQILVTVRDNGIGINASDLTKVFDMFHQVKDEKQRGQSGLGIGLSLVKSLLTLHGGSIDVDSPGRGQGSTFVVRLPSLPEGTPLSPPVARINDRSHQQRSLRVLVVEDTRANRAVLVSLLRRLGHEVEQAVDGIDGLVKAEEFRPQVILSDISMPLMNGYEMVRKLRESDEKTHIVALSGFGQEADRDIAKSAGFDGYMIKPVDIRDLEQLFDELSRSGKA